MEESEKNKMKREMHGALGERWARDWVEERRREMVRRDSGKQAKRHPLVNSGII